MYKIIIDKLQNTEVNKEIKLQIVVKEVNQAINYHGLVVTLLVFDVYSQLYALELPASSVSQQAIRIKYAIDEIGKIRAEDQVLSRLSRRIKR